MPSFYAVINEEQQPSKEQLLLLKVRKGCDRFVTVVNSVAMTNTAPYTKIHLTCLWNFNALIQFCTLWLCLR